MVVVDVVECVLMSVIRKAALKVIEGWEKVVKQKVRRDAITKVHINLSACALNAWRPSQLYMQFRTISMSGPDNASGKLLILKSVETLAYSIMLGQSIY